MKVVLTGEAQADLLGIGDYIAADSRAQAARIVSLIREKSASIGQTPRGFPVVEGRADKEAMRRRPVGSYVIYYYIDADRVIVARVLHAARDFERILFPDA